MTAELLEWELNGKLNRGGLGESRPGSPTTEQLKEIEDQWQEGGGGSSSRPGTAGTSSSTGGGGRRPQSASILRRPGSAASSGGGGARPGSANSLRGLTVAIHDGGGGGGGGDGGGGDGGGGGSGKRPESAPSSRQVTHWVDDSERLAGIENPEGRELTGVEAVMAAQKQREAALRCVCVADDLW